MRKAIAIGLVGLALFANRAVAQTAPEQARILGDFERSVVDYTQRHKCLDLLPEAVNAASPAPKIFTLPVAMVFRQLIARAPVAPNGTPVIEVLPQLPAPLEYRLVENDLAIRDTSADVTVAVLRNALGLLPAR